MNPPRKSKLINYKPDGYDMKSRHVEYQMLLREKADPNHATTSYIKKLYPEVGGFLDRTFNKPRLIDDKKNPSSLEDAYKKNYYKMEDEALRQRKYASSKTTGRSNATKREDDRTSSGGSDTTVSPIIVKYKEYKNNKGETISTKKNNCVNGTCNTLDLPVKGVASVYNPSLRETLLKGDYYLDKGGIDNIKAGDVLQTMRMKDSRGLLHGVGDAKKETPSHARAVMGNDGKYLSYYDNHGSELSNYRTVRIDDDLRKAHKEGIVTPDGQRLSVRTDALIYNPLKARLQKLNNKK